jgi:chemotaxis protein methyltransferase CheR
MENAIDDAQHLELLEVELLLTAVAQRYGYDFREYARPSLLRRVRRALEREGLRSFSALQERVLRDRACFRRFLDTLCVHTTSMFRDTDFYLALRREIVPMLRTYPFARIWHAGSSTGEEVYSLAIILEEEGLYDRCRIYATDLNDTIVERARRGIYPLAAMQEYTAAYQKAGGKNAFSSYYIADRDNAVLGRELKRNVIFSAHNLSCDRAFNEFQLVLCRNVMIYFGDALRGRVHQLLHDSLASFGVLGIGKKETLQFTKVADCYRELPGGVRLYRRVR